MIEQTHKQICDLLHVMILINCSYNIQFLLAIHKIAKMSDLVAKIN